jgi:hypothetical protein
MFRKKYHGLNHVGLHFWFALMTLFSLAMASTPIQAAEAVCAEVKIVIEQKLSFERQAFDAKMIINNGLDPQAVKDVNVELLFMDADRQPVSATQDPNATEQKFFYRVDSLDGINSIAGDGKVDAKSSAEIHWMIIPTADAAASSRTLYYVGAKVSYTIDGQLTEVEVTPEYIIVKPLPKLALDYFLPKEVYADDPFTEEVEPPVPFTLGVRITNDGFGDSPNTVIESAQPKIVENKQNLLIGFEILGGYVADQPAGKSLLLDFGDIAAGEAKVGRWNMVTTLSGKFVEFNARFSHADELGGALTSLLERVTTHTLVHDVKADLPGRDDVRDFLAQDGDVLRLYESDGTDSLVTDLSTSGRLVNSSGKGTIYLTPTHGYVYAKLDDPYRGSALPIRAVRSDGKVIAPENMWLSKTRNQDLTWAYFIHIFDADSTGEYVFDWTQEPKTAISGTVYEDANENGAKEPNERGIGVVDVTLKGIDDEGTNVSLVAYTNRTGVFAFSDLNAGVYSLAVGAVEGMSDGMAASGDAGGIIGSAEINAIQLTAGVRAQGYLFAKQSAGSTIPAGISLSGSVYLDSNNNGALDPTEAGLLDVTVVLTGISNDDEIIYREVHTNASGQFVFNGLAAGRYSLAAKAVEGMTDGAAAIGDSGGTATLGVINAIVLTDSVDAQGYLLAKVESTKPGELLESTLSGRVELIDDTGLLSALPHVKVTLMGNAASGGPSKESLLLTVDTDASGQFMFDKLKSGVYSLVVGDVEGTYTDYQYAGSSSGNSETMGTIAYIYLADGDNSSGYYFRKRAHKAPEQLSSVAGKLFIDENGNGIYDEGERGIAGSIVGASSVQMMGSGGVTVTNENGDFEINGLMGSTFPGDGLYMLWVDAMYSTFPGKMILGSAGGTAYAYGMQFELPIATKAHGYGFARTAAPYSSSISGSVYEDTDGNGTMDEGELGLGGIPVTLSGAETQTAVTDFSGRFEFRQLNSGRYTLSVGDVRRLLDGQAVIGSAGGDMVTQGRVQNINLVDGVDAQGYLFAKTYLAEGSFVSGGIYEDINGNGMMDSNESRIANVEMMLSGVTSHGLRVNKTIVTDDNGLFSLGDLDFGVYSLSAAAVEGMSDSSGIIGSAGGNYQHGGTIAMIRLNKDSVHGEGYYFAKRSDNAADLHADLNVNVYDSSAGKPLVGKEINLSWTVQNLGPDSVSDAKLNVTLPPSITLITADTGYDNGVWDIGRLLSKESKTLRLTVKADNLDDDLMFNATVISERADPNAGNNTHSLIWKGRKAAKTDLEISFDSSSARIPTKVGEQKLLFLKVKNNGPDTAFDITSQIVLPDNLKYIRHTAWSGSRYSNGQWQIDSLESGKYVDLWLTMEVLTLDDDISVNAKANNSHGVDLNTANNSTLLFWKGRNNNQADLSVALSSYGNNQINKNINLQLNVANAGPDSAFNTVVSIELPAPVTLIKAPKNCSFSGRVGTCTIDELKSTFPSYLSLTVQTSTFAGNPTVKASVRSQGKDPNNANNSATYLLRSGM